MREVDFVNRVADIPGYARYSYGTVLGATFAAMRPDLVKRMVLDGVSNAESYFDDVLQWGRDGMAETHKVCSVCRHSVLPETNFVSDAHRISVNLCGGWSKVLQFRHSYQQVWQGRDHRKPSQTSKCALY